MASDNCGGLPRPWQWSVAGQGPAGIPGQPAPHSIPSDPKHLRHLAAGVGLLSLEGIEGLQTLLSQGLAVSGEEPFQLLRHFVDRRERLVHGDRLQLPPRFS
jgi:hypothetical protein